MNTAANAGADQSTPPGAGELEPGERLVTLDEALEFAQRVHRAGHLPEAEKIYRAVLERRPDDADALHFLGVLRHQQGASDEAVELIRRAAALMPDQPGPWNNLGNVFVETGRVEEAIEAYRRCLELAPDFADTYNNLGTLHKARREWAQAEACYRRAIAARPEFSTPYANLGNLMLAQGRIGEAVTYACRAITLRPRDAGARKLLGFAYYTLREFDKAEQVYREWLADEPDNPIALHHLAACTGKSVPHRASDAYVETTFDDFAGSFDAKLERLDYRAPRLIADALGQALGTPAHQAVILDAGCGTGLAGLLIRGFASRLEGVDLSLRMLERARARNIYDRLEKGELTAFLEGHPGRYDAIVSADTLCYFGALEALARAAFAALRDDGILIFTLEAADGDDTAEAGYRINPHGRYSHHEDYVRRCLAQAGFAVAGVARETLRSERGEPVSGLVVSCRRAPQPSAA